MEELIKKVECLEAKINMLFDCLAEIDLKEDREGFEGRWKDRVSEVDADQKMVLGPDWNEMDGIFNFYRKHKDEDGFNEEAIIGGYLDTIKAKFAKLRGQATTTESNQLIDAAEEKVEEIKDGPAPEEKKQEDIEAVVENTEAVVEAIEEDYEEPPMEEVESALAVDLLLGL